jgi:hypothetical protein
VSPTRASRPRVAALQSYHIVEHNVRSGTFFSLPHLLFPPGEPQNLSHGRHSLVVTSSRWVRTIRKGYHPPTNDPFLSSLRLSVARARAHPSSLPSETDSQQKEHSRGQAEGEPLRVYNRPTHHAGGRNSVCCCFSLSPLHKRRVRVRLLSLPDCPITLSASASANSGASASANIPVRVRVRISVPFSLSSITVLALSVLHKQILREIVSFRHGHTKPAQPKKRCQGTPPRSGGNSATV